MRLRDIDNSVIETRDREIQKLQVLVMAYHNIFQGLIEKIRDEVLNEEVCGLCYLGIPCDHVNNPDETCVYIKLADAGDSWEWSKEEIKEQVDKSQNAIFHRCERNYEKG